MKLSDFDYNLPESLIAQYPLEDRSSSRLMVIDRLTGTITHTRFSEITQWLNAGDALILNDTRVIPARLLGIKKDTGAQVELFLLEPRSDGTYLVLSRPAKRLKHGARIVFGDGELAAEVVDTCSDMPEARGKRLVRFSYEGDFFAILERIGRMPLPPYIKREADTADRRRYQTVFARYDGAVAAPTAGLHFTTEFLTSLKQAGVTVDYLTLHVGAGTFRPVEVTDITRHVMDTEYFELSQSVCDTAHTARGAGRRVIACGTTVTRTLESVADDEGTLCPEAATTNIFIYPPYKFKIVDSLLTNFHLPQSTLMMLVCAFGGRDLIMRAYREAVEAGYRFYSYGDAMLIV